MTDQKFKEEAIVEGSEELTVGGERILLPEQEPLDALIMDITKILAPNFNNPALMEWKYAIKFEVVEDIPGKGQVYTKWAKPSMNSKSTLFAIAKAVGMRAELGQKFDPLFIKGLHCRIMLVNKDKDDLVYQNIDKVLPPKS